MVDRTNSGTRFKTMTNNVQQARMQAPAIGPQLSSLRFRPRTAIRLLNTVITPYSFAAYVFAALTWSRVSHLPKSFITGFLNLRPLEPVPRVSTMTTMYWSSDTT